MDAEYEKTIEAVKFAIQIEIEGKAYYQGASKKSSNDAGRQLFEWLAGQEGEHRSTFEQIYKTISEKNAWPLIKFESDATSRAKNVFLNAIKNLKHSMDNGRNELDIVAGAIELEEKTQIFYKQRAKEAKQEIERHFYQSISEEEQGHYITLADYREYIIDPAGYFARHERHSLDGA